MLAAAQQVSNITHCSRRLQHPNHQIAPTKSPTSIFRFLELVEYSQSGHDEDLSLAEAGLWIKWCSGSSLLSQVPFPLHAVLMATFD
jgi:hypothetical protein